MSGQPMSARANQRGLVLVSSLLLLLVVTILALAMFRSMGLAEKISGNVREKQRAVHAAMVAEQYAEWWLTTNGNSSHGAGRLQRGAECKFKPGPDLQFHDAGSQYQSGDRALEDRWRGRGCDLCAGRHECERHHRSGPVAASAGSPVSSWNSPGRPLTARASFIR